MASSEVVPFAKSGGMADVCGALPREIAKLGHRPVVFLPAYRRTKDAFDLQPTEIRFTIPIASKLVEGRLLRTQLPDSDVPVYLVEQDAYYDRSQLYGENGSDYADNCERFVFFCRAVLESIPQLDQPIDLIHCNDWQTGLIPAYLSTLYTDPSVYAHIAVLLTIHNLAYQGQFWHWDMSLTGLDWQHFNWQQLEHHGQLNLLKAGIVFADRLNAVSPQYAEEIQTPALGCGLDAVLAHRRDRLTGIINGVDYSVWDPASDPWLARRYDASSFVEGKAACKADLQRRLELPVEANVPMLGLVGRLAQQKGWDLVLEVMRRWIGNRHVQWIVLGTGDPSYERELQGMAREMPNRVAARLEFSEHVAHQIEAAADMFVMPSHYEPCGLNQLYSLKYGAVPIVRHTGGLADTIRNADEASLGNGTATGFSFVHQNADALEATLDRACHMFLNQPDTWHQLVTTAMNQDWSWTRSAQEYERLYQQTISTHRER